MDKDPILILKLKECRLQTGTIKLVHPINLKFIEDTIVTLTKFSYNTLDTNTSLYNLIEHKIKKLTDNFYQLKPLTHVSRSKRWDAIGKVFKFIAGSPDADDLRMINSTMNQLITDNHEQYHLNERINVRLEQLTSSINELILESNTNDQVLKEVQAIKLVIRIDTVNQLLQDIQDAILSIKASLPNNKILTIEELMQIKSFLIKQGIETATLEEALTYVEPKMALKDNTLLYIIQLPEMEQQDSDLLLLAPLPVSGKTIEQHPKYLIKSSQKFYTTTNPEHTIQRIPSFTPFHDTCITQLILGKQSSCVVTEDTECSSTLITDNKVLITNAQNHTLSTDCGPDNRNLFGNFLLSFDNCSITFDKIQYQSIELTTTAKEVQGALYNLNLQEKLLKREMLTTIPPQQLENRKLIRHVYLQQSTHKIWLYSLFGITIFLLSSITAAVWYVLKFRKTIFALLSPLLGKPLRQQIADQEKPEEPLPFYKKWLTSKKTMDEDVHSSSPGEIIE